MKEIEDEPQDRPSGVEDEEAPLVDRESGDFGPQETGDGDQDSQDDSEEEEEGDEGPKIILDKGGNKTTAGGPEEKTPKPEGLDSSQLYKKPYSFLEHMGEIFLHPFRRFINYYFAQMVVNAASLSFYAAMAFMPRIPCKGEKVQGDPSALMTLTFFIGFGMHAVNFITASFVEPTLRIKYNSLLYSEGETSEARTILLWIVVLEHIFKVIFVLFSLFQIMVTGNPAVVTCTKPDLPVLALEVKWTFMLAMSQLISVPVFLAWRWFVKFDNERKSTDLLLQQANGAEIWRPPVQRGFDAWDYKNDKSFTAKEAKKGTIEQRTKKLNTFNKKFKDRTKLINSQFEEKKTKKNKNNGNQKTYAAHNAFQFIDYELVDAHIAKNYAPKTASRQDQATDSAGRSTSIRAN